MDLEIVTVGSELLTGQTVDTNAAEIARALSTIGARVVRRATVADTPHAVQGAVGDALARARFVVVTGGLGPTRDDVTRPAVAALFGRPLVTDQTYLRQLEDQWSSLGRPGAMPEANRTQAEIPEHATVLPNPTGTAPGLWLEGPSGVAVLLPGVPREMRLLLHAELTPRIRERMAQSASAQLSHTAVLRTTGIAESAVADLLRETDEEAASVTFGYLPSLAGVDVWLTERVADEEAGPSELQAVLEHVAARLGRHCYADGDTDLAAVVLGLLAARGARLGVAESCTGGLVGGRLTDVPGASAVFAGGVIAYANETKERQLGVEPDLLKAHGAVSGPVASAMAAGVQRVWGVEAAIAVSGIAGPEGGTPEKPVGTIWIAARLDDRERLVHLLLPGDRHDIRHRGAQAALDALRVLLEESP